MAELKGADRFDYEVVKLIRLMDADDMTMQMLEMGLKLGVAQLEAEAEVEGSDFQSEEFIERFRQKIDIDSVVYHMVPIYSRYYTHEEIAGLIAFYETPLGRKLIKELPQITMEILAASQEWIEPLIVKMANDLDSIS